MSMSSPSMDHTVIPSQSGSSAKIPTLPKNSNNYSTIDISSINADNSVTPSLECLSWSNLSYTLKLKKEEKTLVRDMYGTLRAGEVIGIIGASGSGKSTLLNILAGRIGPGTLTGEILLDGRLRNPKNWRLICSYVEQDDAMFTNFTVYETLMFAAMLRLPSSMSSAEKMARVENVITELGLNRCRDTQIGTPEKKGISGGERKRLTMGIELVTDPNLIFLDEPTSGLDSFNALNIMSHIRSLATNRLKLVLLTIHQPRTDILDMFDKIILLSEGRPVWYGSTDAALAHFESFGHHIPTRTNPSDFFLDIASIDHRSDELAEQSMKRIVQFADAYQEIRRAENHGAMPQDLEQDTHVNDIHWPSTIQNEFITLLKRNFLDMRRDTNVSTTIMVQFLLISILFGRIYGKIANDSLGIIIRQSLCITLPMFQYTVNASAYASTFPQYRMIIKRERSAGSYRSASYFFAKFISILPVVFLSTLILVLNLEFMNGFNPYPDRFVLLLVIFLLNGINAVAFSLAISALSPSARVAQITAPLLASVFLFLSLNIELPNAISPLKWISPFLYISKALVLNEFDDPRRVFSYGGHDMIGPDVLYQVLKYSGPSLVENAFASVGITILFLIVGYFGFNYTSSPFLKLK